MTAAQDAHYQLLRSWNWTAVDAAWSAYMPPAWVRWPEAAPQAAPEAEAAP